MPIPRERWGQIDPPEGFIWYQQLSVANGGGTLQMQDIQRAITNTHFKELVAKLEAWAREHDVHVTSRANQYAVVSYRGRTVYAPARFVISPMHNFNFAGCYFTLERECPFHDCQHKIKATDGQCSGCRRLLSCSSCQAGYGAIQLSYLSEWYQNGSFSCACMGCHPVCAALDNGVGCTNIAVGGGVCRHHGTWEVCPDCAKEFEATNARELMGVRYCNRCIERRCSQCGSNEDVTVDDQRARAAGRRYALPNGRRRSQRLCRPCKERKEKGMMEKPDPAAASMTARELVVPDLPARPVRVISVEQEFCQPEGLDDYTKANELAGKLYGMGLCSQPRYVEYHHGNPAGRETKPCYMERDATVNGGELVYNRLRMNKIADVESFKTIMGVMEKESAAGGILFNLKCGNHIHVDAHGYSYGDCRALATVFGYLEDVLCRIAASHYTDHRAILFDKEYSDPIIKGKWRTNADFAVEFLRRAKNHDALSFSHYYKAIRTCRCGAVEVGTPEGCGCDLGKCTIEWRIFNGTANLRKMHAYIALAQSLTAWCQQREVNSDDFEPLSLAEGTNFDDSGKFTDKERKLVEEWKPRLEWMFRNLTMTESEFKSVLYCIENSTLRHVGADFIRRLPGLPKITDNRRLTCPTRGARPGPNDPPPPPPPPQNVDGIYFDDAYPQEYPEDGDIY